MNSYKTHVFNLYSFANLIAAIGGGMILGQGVDVIDFELLKGASILAFFMGTVIGLTLLQIIPKKWSANIARWFGVLGGTSSLVLLYLYKNYNINAKLQGNVALIFFAVLCIRFGFWFYARVLRASVAAGQQQNIGWVEFGYYSGMIIGLIFWKILNINLLLTTALILDSILQLSAGTLDVIANKIYRSTHTQEAVTTQAPKSNTTKFTPWIWRLASAVTLMTIGIQVTTFNIAHHLSDSMTSYLMACYYFGVALAAIICKKYRLELQWWKSKASICANNTVIPYSYLIFSLSTLISMALMLYGLILYQWKNWWILALAIFSALCYELLALTILDRIGLEEKLAGAQGMIIKTFGLMGIAAAISLWLLSLANNILSTSFYVLLCCIVTANMVIWKREAR